MDSKEAIPIVTHMDENGDVVAHIDLSYYGALKMELMSLRHEADKLANNLEEVIVSKGFIKPENERSLDNWREYLAAK